MEGYIKVFRKLKEWEWYKDSQTLHLFIHLLLNANFKPSKFMGFDVLRGQLVCGRKQLSYDTGISEQSLRTILERLKSTNELTITSTSKFSIITICNYEIYQDKEKKSTNKSTSKLTSNQPAINQQSTTSEECKEEKEKETPIEIPTHLLKIWKHYIEMRNLIKRPATKNAQLSIIKKLNKLSPNNEIEQIAIIQQSIDNSWQGVFELKHPITSEERCRLL